MNASLKQTSPILVIGMHRSGTRLLDEILHSLGIFMGADRQADGESMTFLKINESLFHLCSTFWNEPMPVHFVLSDQGLLEQATVAARESLSVSFENYTGRNPDWTLHSFPDDGPQFGWKDPRNTFTLPVWKQIFPDLKVIHIVRHGADVAASVVRRHGIALREATRLEVPPPLTIVRDALGIMSSRRGWTLSEALTMWEQYVEKARLEAAALGEGRSMEIRFEDLLQQPEQHIESIAAFCGVPVSAQSANVIANIDRSRAFAFRGDKKLARMAEAFRGVLERLDYVP